MPDSAGSRPWKVIAEEVSREQDPARLTELIEELTHALDEQGIGSLNNRTNRSPIAKVFPLPQNIDGENDCIP